jgi:hypothetical protein
VFEVVGAFVWHEGYERLTIVAQPASTVRAAALRSRCFSLAKGAPASQYLAQGFELWPGMIAEPHWRAPGSMNTAATIFFVRALVARDLRRVDLSPFNIFRNSSKVF